MRNDKIYSDVLRYVKTKSDAEEMLAELDSLSESIYSTDQEGIEKALSELRASHASAMREALGKGVDKLTFFKELREKIVSLKALKLTLAFEPTDEFVERLFEWTADNVGEGIVLDFEVNPEIIAGAIISYNGRYFDFSLSSYLNG